MRITGAGCDRSFPNIGQLNRHQKIDESGESSCSRLIFKAEKLTCSFCGVPQFKDVFYVAGHALSQECHEERSTLSMSELHKLEYPCWKSFCWLDEKYDTHAYQTCAPKRIKFYEDRTGTLNIISTIIVETLIWF